MFWKLLKHNKMIEIYKVFAEIQSLKDYNFKVKEGSYEKIIYIKNFIY